MSARVASALSIKRPHTCVHERIRDGPNLRKMPWRRFGQICYKIVACEYFGKTCRLTARNSQEGPKVTPRNGEGDEMSGEQ